STRVRSCTGMASHLLNDRVRTIRGVHCTMSQALGIVRPDELGLYPHCRILDTRVLVVGDTLPAVLSLGPVSSSARGREPPLSRAVPAHGWAPILDVQRRRGRNGKEDLCKRCRSWCPRFARRQICLSSSRALPRP